MNTRSASIIEPISSRRFEFGTTTESSPFDIRVINCVVAGVFLGLVVAALDGDVVLAIVIGVVGFVILFAAQTIWGLLSFKSAAERLVVRFPTPREAR